MCSPECKAWGVYLQREAEEAFWRVASANITFWVRELRCRHEEQGSDPRHPWKKPDIDPRAREKPRGCPGLYRESALPIKELQVQSDPVSKYKVESD